MKDISHVQYRPDIDGLRAIAVLSVIIFHINEHLLPGGFVGVDIFFVISGYLISLQIFKDLGRGQFSITEFYRRRVKRIAPAMILVVTVTLILSQMLLIPEDAEKVAESGLWSLLSMANIYFWLFQDNSYFAQASSELPLLHLWSLGVEEQFYIFWPLLLLLTHKVSKLTFSVLLGSITIASFCFGEFYFYSDPSFVYYMLPTRAGELLAGAVTAYIVHNTTQPAGKRFQNIISITGSVLIVLSFVIITEDKVFPGFWATIPAAGTAMVIYSGNHISNWITRFLSCRPMIWIGLISYSAYLWHWPILAYIRYFYSDVTPLFGIGAFIATLLLAWGTYLYIETPARRTQGSARTVFIRLYIVPCGLIAFLALLSMKLDGFGFRWLSLQYRTELNTLREETKPAYAYDYVCQSQRITADEISNPKCVIGNNTDTHPDAILWGDSNAAHFVGILGTFAHESNFTFRNLQVGTCPPIKADPKNFTAARRIEDCRQSQPALFQTINEYPVVIVSANWTYYQERSREFLAEFFKVASELAQQDKLVIIIGKIPTIDTYDRRCREKAISFPMTQCDKASVPLDKKIIEINSQLKVFAQTSPNIEYYEINDYICPDGKCFAYQDDTPIYYDSSHLTLNASWEIGEQIFEREGVPYPFTLISSWKTE